MILSNKTHNKNHIRRNERQKTHAQNATFRLKQNQCAKTRTKKLRTKTNTHFKSIVQTISSFLLLSQLKYMSKTKYAQTRPENGDTQTSLQINNHFVLVSDKTHNRTELNNAHKTGAGKTL